MRAGSLVTIGLLVHGLSAQSVGGGRNDARFGVDGDVTGDTLLFGNGASGALNASDDWFLYPSVKKAKGGVGIIDTNGTAYYKYLLQSSATYRENLRFTRGMSMPKLSRSGGYVLLDGLYARDFQNNDKTHIDGTGSIKLIDDPSTWSILSGSMSGKTDITEVYSHVRRKGLTVNDSLFFYFGVGVYATGGSKNIVSELFVNDVTYDTVANHFTNLGSQGGRKAWRFDGAGNVKVIGDMIVSMTYNPGPGTFTLEPQIWMRRSTYDSFRNVAPLFLNPVNFVLGAGNFQSAGSTSYGYVHIEPKGGASTVVAQGSSNDLGATSAAPWGNSVTSGYAWSANYNSNQFIELSINLTRLGVDPALFSGIDPCTIPYRSIVFYSQASASATSAPQDFAGPYPFWRYPEVPNVLTGGGNLNCNNASVSLNAQNANTLAYYKWTRTPIGGGTEDSVGVGTSFTASNPGVYRLKSAPLQGCWEQSSSVTIYEDKVAPIAALNTSTTWEQGTGIDTFDILDGDPSYYYITLYGGNIPASVTAYNAVSGLPAVSASDFSWSLTRHNGGANTVVNNTTLTTNITLGDYYTFTLTGIRNGCVSSQKILITQLPVSILNFDCRPDGNAMNLKWTSADEQGLKYYEIQRLEQNKFVPIGRVTAADNPLVRNAYDFRDLYPAQGWNTYRLAMHMESGNIEYSSFCMSLLNSNGHEFTGLGLIPNPAADMVSFPVQVSDEFMDIRYSVHNALGARLMSGCVHPSGNLVQLNVNQLPAGIYMVQVEMNGKVFKEKLIINR